MSSMPQRVMRFYVVGLVGIAVQISVLHLLSQGLGLHYLWSTALAVEVAIIHNFLWHRRWTWRCRTLTTDSAALQIRRFCIFNLTTGMVSLTSNLVVMRLLVENAGMPHIAANLIAIVCGSAITFLLGEALVFNAVRQSAASSPGPELSRTSRRVPQREHTPKAQSAAADA